MSPEGIAGRFEQSGFICSAEVATSLFLSDALQKPLLLEGPPGVGKTEIARLWSELHGADLIRLQCYEGLDEAKALYEWSYGKQMLYAQLLREKVGDLVSAAPDLRTAMIALRGQADEFFSREFLLARPLLAAITSEQPSVLLVDEVDRSDEEFEAFLLELLSDYQVSIPELGTIKARHVPRVVLTSNDTRDLSDALRRRCLYLYIDFPPFDDEVRIVRRRVPGVSEDLASRIVKFVHKLRKSADARRAPGIAEVVDWARALVALGAQGLEVESLRRSLGALIKNREDLERVLADPARFR
ncbi:MAG TPA: MoxR family ATPase [Patescibacteria group bacterium]|nr:MoxR family ATPase [Patescibacteria group bacterium]